MSSKAEKDRRAVAHLGHLNWAKGLLARLRQRPTDESHLFEARLAYEIARAGVTPIYEQKTEGSSSVDFSIESKGTTWNIELVTFVTSEAINSATVREDVEPGITLETNILGRGMKRSDGEPLLSKQCPESEMLRVLSKLEAKIVHSGKPIKFGIAKPGVYNLLMVDMREYEGIGDPDRDHCRQIAFGPAAVKRPESVMFHPDGAPILGLWSDRNPRDAARLARERLHALAFVHEEAFTDDEIREVTFICANPHLPWDISIYPLRWPNAGRSTPRRRSNSLWGTKHGE